MYTQCQHNQVNGKSLTTRFMGVCFFCLLILNVHFPILVTRYVVILKTSSYNPHKKMVLKKNITPVMFKQDLIYMLKVC